ncbi:MAG: DNA-3-methyladenine glycosylase [bacterium]|nr:DNA-3-methyladenine glycosylase [bacterium]
MTNEFKPLTPGFYRRDPRKVARGLLGRYLVRSYGERKLVLRVVETEAYLGKGDRASHAWTGRPTTRTATLFRAGGCAYVYFVYGIHNMFNAVAGAEGVGGAVLIRAGEPVAGGETMRSLRGLAAGRSDAEIASGPGKLCQALAIDRTFDGADLDGKELQICYGRPVSRRRVLVGPRVGVSYAGKAATWPLRFAVVGNPHVSRPRPPQRLLGEKPG